MRRSPTKHKYSNHNDYQTLAATGAYGPWVGEFIDAGWDAYIVTFMFNHVVGHMPRQVSQMQHEVERVYATLLTRIVRKPRSPRMQHYMPRWVVCPDFPVPKHARLSLRDVTLNNGLHMHGVAMLPPTSRMIQNLNDHFAEHQDLYVRSGHLLRRVHAQAITDSADYVTNYVLKSVFRGRVSYEHVLFLPEDRRSRFGDHSRPTAR